MEIHKQKSLHEDQMSDIRSLGSSHQRCSQSRKMSIGIAPASSGNMSNITGNIYNPKGQKGSPWISPKQHVRRKTLGESFNTAKKVTNITAVDGAYSNLGRVNEPTAGTVLPSGNSKQKNVDNVVPEGGKGSAQEAVKEISLPNEGIKQHQTTEIKSKETLKMKLWEVLRTAPPINKELDGSGSVDVDATIMMQKDGNKEDSSLKPRVNSDTIETDSETPEVAVSRPVTRSLTRKRGPAVARPKRLRKKLFPANQENNVFSFEEKCYGAQHAATGRHLQSKTNSTGKQNLDIRATKASRRMSNIQASSGGKMPSSNAEEISLRSGMGIAHGYQDQGRMKQSLQRENSLSSPEENDSGQLGGRDNQISPENEGKKDHFNGESAPKIANLNDIFGPANKMKTDARLQIPSAQTKEIKNQNYTRSGDRGNHISPDNGGKKDHLYRESAPKIANLINDIFGPANKMNTDARLPIPFAQAKEMENHNTRMLARRIIFVKDAFRFKSTLTAKQINLGSHVRTESSNDSAESDDTVQSMREKHDPERCTSGRRKFEKTDQELSISNGSGEDMDVTPGWTNKFSPMLRSPNVAGEYETTPETGHFEKQMPCQSKQVEVPPKFNYGDPSPSFCFPNEIPTVEGSGDDTDIEKHISSSGCQETHEAVNFNDLSPAFCSPNATVLTNTTQEYQEDGLDRAVALFGCALEKFKNKLVSSTKKRSSEVLESTVEEIHSKFQSAKSLIEKDLNKLTNASRCKRQILEKSFNEQQEQLQLIHKKFKDEIHRHLENFTRTVESLEAHTNDLKVAIERRKASHHKLIFRVEEAVENHLNEAQRKLMFIQNAGVSKMQHMKTAIAGCFEDGIFT